MVTLRSRAGHEASNETNSNATTPENVSASRKRKRINSRREPDGTFVVSGLSVDEMVALGWNVSPLRDGKDASQDSTSTPTFTRKRRKLSSEIGTESDFVDYENQDGVSRTVENFLETSIEAQDEYDDAEDAQVDLEGQQIDGNLNPSGANASFDATSQAESPSQPGSPDYQTQDAIVEEEEDDDDEANAVVAAGDNELSKRTTTDPNELTEEDLLPPFLTSPSEPGTPPTFPDDAARILATKFAAIQPPTRIIAPLTSHTPSDRSTATLFALALNTQRTLLAWQDQYLALDAHTAPVATNPAKKPASGGREPLSLASFESAKENELFATGGLLAAIRPVHPRPAQSGANAATTTIASNGAVVRTTAAARSTGETPPVRHAPGEGRELRHRRRYGTGNAAAGSGKTSESVLDGLGISEDDAGGPAKRARRPARRFEIGLNGEGGTGSASERGSGSRGRGRGVGRGRGRGGRGGASAKDDADEEGSKASSTGSTAAARRAVNGAPRRTGRGSRGKSEKRSESMTLWWAERKRKFAEARAKEQAEKDRLEKEAEEARMAKMQHAQQHTQQHTQQHAQQHTQQHAQQHTQQHAQQHTQQHAQQHMQQQQHVSQQPQHQQYHQHYQPPPHQQHHMQHHVHHRWGDGAGHLGPGTRWHGQTLEYNGGSGVVATGGAGGFAGPMQMDSRTPVMTTTVTPPAGASAGAVNAIRAWQPPPPPPPPQPSTSTSGQRFDAVRDIMGGG